MANSNYCGIMIKQIHDELEKRTNQALRSTDLTLAQLSALLALRERTDCQMTLKELEHTLHLAQSTAAGIAARLEQKGFIETFGNPDDRRIKILRMTESGKSCCQAADRGMVETELSLLSGLTETEKTILLSLLEKVCDTIRH